MSPLLLAVEALPFLLVVALAVLVSILLVWFYRSFGAGVAAFATAFLASACFPQIGGLQIGVRLFPQDLITLLMIVATFLRLLLIPEARVPIASLYVFGGVLSANVVLGLLVNGTAAGVAARPEAYSFVALVYATTFPGDRKQVSTLFRALIWLAFALLLLACVRWFALVFDVEALLPQGGSFQPQGHSIWRVIVSNEALILAQIGVVGLLFAHAQTAISLWRFPALLLLVTVAVLQHRSTWLAGLAAIAAALCLVILRGQVGPTRQRAAGLLVVAALTIGGIFMGMGNTVQSDMRKSFADAIALRGTAGERLSGWRQLIVQWWDEGPRSIAVGRPYGGSTERYTSDELGARKISYQAHNYYVTVLTSLGVVGFVAYLALWWRVARGLLAATLDAESAQEAALFITCLAAQAAYYLTYGTDYMQALILGTALSLVYRREHRLASASVPTTSARWTSQRVPSRQGPQ